jgi:hypothetical protein
MGFFGVKNYDVNGFSLIIHNLVILEPKRLEDLLCLVLQMNTRDPQSLSVKDDDMCGLRIFHIPIARLAP